MLGQPMSGQAVGVGEGFPTHLTTKELFTPIFMDCLMMGCQMEVMAEGLPADFAGVESSRRLVACGGIGSL